MKARIRSAVAGVGERPRRRCRIRFGSPGPTRGGPAPSIPRNSALRRKPRAGVSPPSTPTRAIRWRRSRSTFASAPFAAAPARTATRRRRPCCARALCSAAAPRGRHCAGAGIGHARRGKLEVQEGRSVPLARPQCSTLRGLAYTPSMGLAVKTHLPHTPSAHVLTAGVRMAWIAGSTTQGGEGCAHTVRIAVRKTFTAVAFSAQSGNHPSIWGSVAHRFVRLSRGA